jgi:spore coat protein U-like protein
MRSPTKVASRNTAKYLRLCLGLCAVIAVNASHAQTTPGVVCSVQFSFVGFGGYDPLSYVPLDNQSAYVEVGCFAIAPPVVPATSHTVPYSISLSSGLSGNFLTRTMRNVNETLSYNLYSSNAYNVIWGEGGAFPAVTGTVVGLTLGSGLKFGPRHIIYGRVNARQMKPGGSYNDTINITASY